MDRRERIGDPEETLRMAFDGHQSGMWTALPAIVQKFDAARMTADVQPAIKATIRQQDGTFADMNLPVLLDCPVFFPSGGGCTLTFPVAAGDEVLVIFASRCIDGWWQLGSVQRQPEFRMHDLSDGFVLPGIRSQPRKFGVNTTGAQLRTDDGAAYVEVDPGSHLVKVQTSGNITANAGGSIEMTAAATITLNAPNIVLNGQLTQGKGSNGGDMTIQGPMTVAGDVTAGGKSLINHVHSGVQTGGGTTGKPV